MLRKSLVLPLLIAMVLGLAATLLAHSWMQRRIEAADAEKSGGVPVVVAATQIEFGERIQPAQVRIIYWPKEHVPDGVLSDINQAVGQIANQKLLPNETVLQLRVGQDASGSSLAANIQPNLRAVTVRVNDVIGVAGFLLPGNRVDVLATRMDDSRHATTRTLLQNVKVLAVDQSAQVEKDKPVVVRAVTLELAPREAEGLIQATEEGPVQLALRNPNDSSHVAAAVVPAPPVVVVRRAAAPARSPAPAPKPTVEVIRQSQAIDSEVQQ